MAVDTFFVDIFSPPSEQKLFHQLDRITFNDPMDHPLYEGFRTYLKRNLNIDYNQAIGSRNEIMPLHDNFDALVVEDTMLCCRIVDGLVRDYGSTETRVSAFLESNKDLIAQLIATKGRTYANEFLRVVLQELAELGMVG